MSDFLVRQLAQARHDDLDREADLDRLRSEAHAARASRVEPAGTSHRPVGIDERHHAALRPRHWIARLLTTIGPG